MKSILLFHHSPPWLSLASSSLIKKFSELYPEAAIDIAIDGSSYPLFQYNSRIRDVLVAENDILTHYDLAVNLDTDENRCSSFMDIKAVEKRGFGFIEGEVRSFSEESKDCLQVLSGQARTERHVLQVLFRASGLVWRGNGYDLAYYPKNKMKKGKTGVAIQNSYLRKFVKDNLVLKNSQLWHVPMKKSLLKRIDEINRCKRVITDDLFVLHAAISMRKHVEFLDIIDLNMNVEFFGNGNHIRLLHDSRQLQM